jgi:prepilin-type N-terminal cleavage/methylation domain-containing protein
MARAARARDAAFTLLEILSVVAIFALMAGLALPNFSGMHARNTKHQARRIVAQIELARQRAIVTGIPHRFFIDVDGAAYRIEWLATENPADGEEAASETADLADALDTDGESSIDLTAPRAEERAYRPLPGTLGRFTPLEASIEFAGVETTGGWVDEGETFIRFERDGSADATTIVIEHESGLSVTLEVLPLADTVHVRYETL